MWKLLTCYFRGGHDYAVCCEPGTIFLRCHHCGTRSPGWDIHEKAFGEDSRSDVVEPRRQAA